jgi:hypothetical protein
MVSIADDTKDTCCNRGTSIAARLALHQDELDIVLDYRIGLVRLSEERGSIAFNFVRGIRNFVPNYWSQIVVSDASAVLLDRRMKWDHGVPTVIFATRKTDVPDNTDKASARDQGTEALGPDFIQLVEEKVVVSDMA